MPMRMMVALLLMTAAIGPASAQDNDRGGVRTETESRLMDQSTNDILWNAIGLLGLLGLDRISPTPFRRQLSPCPARMSRRNRRSR